MLGTIGLMAEQVRNSDLSGGPAEFSACPTLAARSIAKAAQRGSRTSGLSTDGRDRLPLDKGPNGFLALHYWLNNAPRRRRKFQRNASAPRSRATRSKFS